MCCGLRIAFLCVACCEYALNVSPFQVVHRASACCFRWTWIIKYTYDVECKWKKKLKEKTTTTKIKSVFEHFSFSAFVCIRPCASVHISSTQYESIQLLPFQWILRPPHMCIRYGQAISVRFGVQCSQNIICVVNAIHFNCSASEIVNLIYIEHEKKIAWNEDDTPDRKCCSWFAATYLIFFSRLFSLLFVVFSCVHEPANRTCC